MTSPGEVWCYGYSISEETVSTKLCGGESRMEFACGLYLSQQHFLYFLPLPHRQGSFRPILGSVLTYGSDAG